MEVALAASFVDADVDCWDLRWGAEQLRYKTCASTPHGLVSVGSRFLASSQIRDSSANAGLVLYWSWSKPQVEAKSFPAEPIRPLAANHPGTYVAGGGLSGDIYFWEVETGRLLKKWHAHYRAVTCLVFSEDDSLLISGSEDGCIRVWSLFVIFDDLKRQEAGHLYEHSFSEHTLSVTDIVIGYGGCNAIIISAAEDRTCKVWSLSRGTLLRNIVFPSIIDAIALDPAEHVFYAGSRHGKIFIAALNAEKIRSHNHEMHIIGSFSNHSKAVTCLTYSASENLLISGSEDGMIRIWNAKTRNFVRMFKHAKGPVNNILVVRKQLDSSKRTSTSQSCSRKQGSLLPPPLEKYSNSTTNEASDVEMVVSLHDDRIGLDVSYMSCRAILNQTKEFQNQGSSASEMAMERLKADCKRSAQMVDRFKKMCEDLQEFYEDDFLKSGQTKT
ncbi:protein ROOT INITIATION DEFECTIVE 3-like [Neltuma alba]|uniref:protein ROOT INITIATION DEFECTIVE 3-like n=1 Tax=Neltuma alba TaxID=207710 RepID=UPI0010A3C1BF|nr:protein ROOT INITIATION DEFECTIVE 3-like [Prosopis alba]